MCAVGFILGYSFNKYYADKEIVKAYGLSEKNKYLFRTAAQWLDRERSGDGICKYLQNNRYKRVAVYGLSHMGKVLIDILESSRVEVVYGIDNGLVQYSFKMPIYSINEELPNVDVVIVTPVYSYEQIRCDLVGKVKCPIVSLADIVFK